MGEVAAGALHVGRRLFDLTSGWGGTHPFGGPVRLGTPEVTPGEGVTHLHYRVLGTNSSSFA